MKDKRFERRYMVIKMKDLQTQPAYIRDSADDVCDAINQDRTAAGKGDLEGIFIERDWPEYQSASAALYNRISGKDIYKGHPNLADMMSTHVDTLIQILENKTVADSDGYIAHEIRALRDIKAAIEAEKSNAV